MEKGRVYFFPKILRNCFFMLLGIRHFFYAILSFHNSRPWLEVTVSTLDTLLLITPSHLLAPGRELRIVSIHRVDVSSLSTKVSCFRFQTTLTMHDGPRNGTQESVFAPRKDTKVRHKTHTNNMKIHVRCENASHWSEHYSCFDEHCGTIEC